MKNQRSSANFNTADVEKFSHDGRGITRIAGKTVFLQGALPGEKVSFRYLNKKKNFDEGEVIEVLTPSPQRVSPACAHYQICGGCSLQHLQQDVQIHEKQLLLTDTLQRIGHVQPRNILAPLINSSWNYRSKARLSVRYVTKKQSILLGFREKNQPSQITEISQCPVLDARINLHFEALRELLNALQQPDCISQVEVAAGDADVALIFRNITAVSDDDKVKFQCFSQKTGFKIFLQPGNSDSIQRLYPEEGDDFLHYTLPEENICFKFHPGDFTQVNPGINRLMISQAMELLALTPDDRALDFFCGLGNFSLPMARRCTQVTGVEGSQSMVLRAATNARLNSLKNANFLCGDLNKPDSLSKIPGTAAITKILLDPPRSGALEIIRQLSKLKAGRIVYISCNPATLARDADILVNQQGYRLSSAGVLDMFPHTSHVESMALFEKR